MFFIFFIIYVIFNSALVASAGLSPSYWDKKDISNLAVVIVPVANVAPFPLSRHIGKTLDIGKMYQEFSYAPKIGIYSCLRLHQLLFNEIVIIKKELDQEVKVEFPGLFYINDNGKHSSEFWTLRKYVRPLSNKFFKKINLSTIPAPFVDKKGHINKSGILTLKCPWYDKITNLTYSAGTRFVRNINKDTVDKFGVMFTETKNFRKIENFVPKELAIVEYPNDQKESIKLFMNLLKTWAGKNSIPYVWGGASFIDQIKENKFYEVSQIYLSSNISFYVRPGMPRPYSGFECSSLILRVAQIVGMPYFCKNTAAIYRTLRPLKNGEKLEEGDLIWYRGHVQIISNLKENKLIEAVGYQYGYGLLHEIALSKVFQDINNYNKLIKAYLEKLTIKRMDNNGVPVRTIENFLLLKLNSIFT